jgi:hypothetical protein
MTDRPQIENSPGIAWRRKGDGWEAIWRARADLIARGFTPKNQHLWSGDVPTETEAAAISDTCRRLQDEMLIFGRGGLPQVGEYDGTLESLVKCYQTDPDSTYHKKRYAVRMNHNGTYREIVKRHGHLRGSDFNARLFLALHREWSDDGKKIAMGHSFIGHLRTFFRFGFTILEDPECERLCNILHELRFKAPAPRTERLTAEQAAAVRKVAREHFGWPSIALAQALQFDLMLRQKDVIGEWVPLTEPGLSDVTKYNAKWVKQEGRMVRVESNEKWLCGLRWSEINENLILKHNTSKRGKDLTVDLKLAPMVIEELELGIVTRDDRGPVIICELTGLPYSTAEFRRKWRLIADKAGVPKSVRNMDSRSGAISEATDAGIDLEHIRHAATHSNISMTQRYSRGSDEKIATVQRLRLAHRNKPKT